jgi:hypothetical protein
LYCIQSSTLFRILVQGGVLMNIFMGKSVHSMSAFFDRFDQRQERVMPTTTVGNLDNDYENVTVATQ